MEGTEGIDLVFLLHTLWRSAPQLVHDSIINRDNLGNEAPARYGAMAGETEHVEQHIAFSLRLQSSEFNLIRRTTLADLKALLNPFRQVLDRNIGIRQHEGVQDFTVTAYRHIRIGIRIET